MFKIVVIGSTGIGKTNIATRYMKNQYNQSAKSSVGVQFLSKLVKVRNQNIKVTVWDTAGQQRYKSLSKVYYKGANGILIVYDVTSPQSYLDVQSWMRLAIVLMVAGNKIDLQNQRKVSTDRPIIQYKEKFDIDCWQVSAKTGQIYQMTMKMRESHIPFQYDDSSIYESVVQGSAIIPQASQKNVKKGAKNQQKKAKKPLSAAQQVQDIKISNVPVKNKKQNAEISSSNETNDYKKVISPKNDEILKLENNNKKNTNRKEKKSCC